MGSYVKGLPKTKHCKAVSFWHICETALKVNYEKKSAADRLGGKASIQTKQIGVN